MGKAKIIREGKDITIVSSSYMTLEALRAARILAKDRINAEIIDLRTIKPIDEEVILDSIKKTGRLIVVDGAWRSFGTSAEILALAAEKSYGLLKCAPTRIAFPDHPIPTSWSLANRFYPRAIDIVNATRKTFGLAEQTEEQLGIFYDIPLDVPDKTFIGPF